MDWHTRMVALCVPPFESSQDMHGSHGNGGDAHAYRIGDSIRYSSDAANAAGLAQTDDAALVSRFGDFQVNDDFADIADAGELVKLHVGVQYPADLLIHDAL